MITYRADPPIEISGHTITLITRVQITAAHQNGALLAAASKSPAAVRIHDGAEEKLFVLDPEWEVKRTGD